MKSLQLSCTYVGLPIPWRKPSASGTLGMILTENRFPLFGIMPILE
jgi:hypothetical protein